MLPGHEFSQSLGREEKRAGKESSSPVSCLQHLHVHLYSHLSKLRKQVEKVLLVIDTSNYLFPPSKK